MKTIDENAKTNNENVEMEDIGPTLTEPKLTMVDKTGKSNAAELQPGGSSDPFDPINLRLTVDYTTAVSATKLLTTVPVKRPDRAYFFRVHPSPEFILETNILERRDEGETYVVHQDIALSFPHDVVAKRLYLTLTVQGVPALWPVRLPGEDGRLDPWNESAHAIAEIAMKRWVRVVSNRHLGAYQATCAVNIKTEPEWPAVSFKEILRIAFRDRIITSLDHPVLRRLRGEM